MSDMQNDDLKQQYQKIMESEEGAPNLGRVDMNKYSTSGLGVTELADKTLGYHALDVQNLPSAGRFYPADASLSIRAARVAEIRNFSIVEENNILDIDEKLNYIVKNCIRFTSKSKNLSYKDLLEEDRFFVLLSIRDLTFPEPENRLMTKGTNRDGEEFDVEIKSQYFQISKTPEEIEKYYDDVERCYNVQTKSFGTIKIKPPTIGVMEVITDYIKIKQVEKKQWDQSFLQILPYIQLDWRGFNDKSIFKGEVDFQGWNERKYMVVYKLAEKIKVGIQPEMLVQHGDEEVLVPINFRDGIKSLFFIQDLTGELL